MPLIIFIVGLLALVAGLFVESSPMVFTGVAFILFSFLIKKPENY